MNGEEALEYLSNPKVMQIKRPGEDAQCDAAVATFCDEFRHAGPIPRFYRDESARRACSVLLIYASQDLSRAALASQPVLLEKGLVAMDVSDAATLDVHEAGRILDRFIMLVGTVKAELLLVSAALRMELSDELTMLIKQRLAKIG